jgi:hypothetical protein
MHLTGQPDLQNQGSLSFLLGKDIIHFSLLMLLIVEEGKKRHNV